MINLYEKYRPKQFDQVLGQDKAIREIKCVLDRGWGGRAWWISGCTGTGKTTLARIIASIMVDEFYITEYDAADKVDSAELDIIERTMFFRAPGKGGRAFIINETHGMKSPIIRRFLGLLE